MNTKSGANTELAAIAIMKAVVAGKKPANVITYSSSACSHDDIDTDLHKTLGDLKNIINLVENFVNTCHYHKIDSSYNVQGSIPQKIVKNKKMPDGYVKYETPPPVTVV